MSGNIDTNQHKVGDNKLAPNRTEDSFHRKTGCARCVIRSVRIDSTAMESSWCRAVAHINYFLSCSDNLYANGDIIIERL